MATKASVESAAYEPEALPSISASKDEAAAWKGDLLLIGVYEEALKTADGEDKSVSIADGTLADLDSALSGIVGELLEDGEFKAKKGSTTPVLRLGGAARRVALVGLGKSTDGDNAQRWGPSAFKAAGAALAKAAASSKSKTAAFSVVGAWPADAAQDIAFGVVAAPGPSERFKSAAKAVPLSSVSLLTGNDVAAAVSRGVAFGRGTLFARYLVEAPPNVCSPTYLAGAAEALAAEYGTMSVKILEKKDCEEMGMGCYLGVSQASDAPPKFIHLTYTPSNGASRKIALVGKGVTFDTGGYNLKAGAGSLIEKMKFDMGGAAGVFGAAKTIAELAPSGAEIHFISAACENMINGEGLRPGDVLVSASGKTVEIGNTDAEGRLTLCDALWYAQEKVGASKCLDMATLTGAQIVALGMSIGAVMAPDDATADATRAAGAAVGEKWWQMPLDDEYFDLLKSKCADMNNIGGRWAGSITAGLYLKQFVDGDKMEWAHLDMAGPVWSESDGATGFGAATLAAWAEAQGE